MLTYSPSPKTDLQLYAWYERLILSGDMKRQFEPIYHALSVFLAYFQEPTTLFYESDEEGLWACVWSRPSYGATAEVHVWVRKERRHTKAALGVVTAAFDTLLNHYAAIFAVTRDEATAGEREKLGFVRFGELPSFDDTGPTFITYLTRENFDAATSALAKRHAHG